MSDCANAAGPWLADYENFAAMAWRLEPENVLLTVSLMRLERRERGALCLLGISRSQGRTELHARVGPVALHATRASAGQEFDVAQELHALLCSPLMAAVIRRSLPPALLEP